jgi:hypothetical protein
VLIEILWFLLGFQADEGNEDEDDDGAVVWVQKGHGAGVHEHVASCLWVNAAESGEDLVRLKLLLFFRNLDDCSLVLIPDLWVF